MLDELKIFLNHFYLISQLIKCEINYFFINLEHIKEKIGKQKVNIKF